ALPISGHCGSGSAGSQANRQPAITSTAGSSAAWARTIVVLAVPFSPRTRTPPMDGETALRVRASAMSAEPTTALNGNTSNQPSTRSRPDGPSASRGRGRSTHFPVRGRHPPPAGAAQPAGGPDPVLEVVGVGADGPAGLPAASLQIIESAEVLIGGRRHLAAVPAGLAPDAERAPWPSPLLPGLGALLDE